MRRKESVALLLPRVSVAVRRTGPSAPALREGIAYFRSRRICGG